MEFTDFKFKVRPSRSITTRNCIYVYYCILHVYTLHASQVEDGTIKTEIPCYMHGLLKNPYCPVDGSTANAHRSIFKASTSLKRHTETSIILEVLPAQMVVQATHTFTFLLNKIIFSAMKKCYSRQNGCLK